MGKGKKKKKQKEKLEKQNHSVSPALQNNLRKHLAIIVVCGVVIWLLASESGMLRFVPLVALVLAANSLVRLMAMGPQILGEYFPVKPNNKTPGASASQVLYYLSTFLFIGGLFAIAFTIKDLENTLNGMQLLWISGGIGGLLGILILVVLHLANRNLFFDSVKRFTVYVGLVAGLFCIFPSIAIRYNEPEDDTNKYCEKVKLDKLGQSANTRRRSKRHGSYWAFITFKGKQERYDISKKQHTSLKEGDLLEICLVPGKLDYDKVVSIQKAD
ncbi:MAG: hypothetical protein N4A46_07940 [Schleiferiaceae bacterium]|jgi:hypothetical protein|nr:hypothetical protein [Schleiferiaceae bacterium]